MSDQVKIAKLQAWAERRKAAANAEYFINGRGDYGDLAGTIEVCNEIIEWCERGYWSEPDRELDELARAIELGRGNDGS